jgi:drug/metabolite transporter (DMT)-like permease
MPFGRPWELRQSWSHAKWAVFSGLCFFAHLTGWFVAIRLVSIAIATTMLALLPVVVIFLEYIINKRKPNPNQLLGIGIALVGVVLIVLNSIDKPSKLLGILVMVAALFAGAFYLMFSMKAQEKLNSWQTVSILYPTTCLAFGLMVLITGQQVFGLLPTTYGWILSVAIVPTFFGHALLNMSIKKLSPVTATTATLAEPIIAAVIAWLWFGETITVLAGIGAAIAIAGIYIALRPSKPSDKKIEQEIINADV